jgi:hypothetical protein
VNYFLGGGAEGALPTFGDAPFPTDTAGDAPFCIEVGELPLFSSAISSSLGFCDGI